MRGFALFKKYDLEQARVYYARLLRKKPVINSGSFFNAAPSADHVRAYELLRDTYYETTNPVLKADILYLIAQMFANGEGPCVPNRDYAIELFEMLSYQDDSPFVKELAQKKLAEEKSRAPVTISLINMRNAYNGSFRDPKYSCYNKLQMKPV